ncbi:MAG: carboxypeptidase-like regulatory domain-containing protein [Chitinophagaceae bacterium]|nr:carboxypeptidase-like regulatory domain-containing protein [Chitinophagaceae bacterium]
MRAFNEVKGKITNEFTQEYLSQVSIYWQKAGWGTLSDSLGFFKLKKSSIINDTLVIKYVGYADVFKPINFFKDTIIYSINMQVALAKDPVVVKSKFSKGLRWWKSIVQHKKENDVFRFSNYSYELYNKMEIDINNINKEKLQKKKLFKPFAFVLDNTDTTSEAKPFLPVYLTETLSDYYYSKQPNKIREEIKAVQTQGIKNESILQFAGGINQKMNIYNDFVNVFGKEFISPLSRNGDNFYYYKGTDTMFINGERFFHLSFSPLKEGSNVFAGDCWVHQNTWAIQKITLNVAATANINFVNRLSIVQEFKQVNKTQWMFSKDKFIAEIAPLKKDGLSFIARKTCLYNKIKIDDPAILNELAKNKKSEEVIIKEGARSIDSKDWNGMRPEPLAMNEQKVYKMIDTIKSLPAFKKYSDALTLIFDGHKKFGMIEIGPWFKWFSGNQMEKVRVRFDLGTTEKFSNALKLHGYLAYGFKDEKMKGKFEANYKFPSAKGWQINASYINDLDNGKVRLNNEDATTDNMFSQLIRRSYIKQKFIRVEEYKAFVSKEWENNLGVQLSFARADYDIFNPLPHRRFFSRRIDEKLINSEVAIKFRYAPGEKKIASHRKERRFKGDNPVFELSLATALPHVAQGEYSYKKITFNATQKFRLHSWGTIDYRVYAGKIFGDNLPFALLELHPGNEIYYYNKQSFNLMNRFEYVSDKYAGINIEHNFEKKLLNLIPFLRKTKIRQFWNLKSVWGDLSIPNRKFNRTEFGDYRLKSLKDNAYTELGTGFDNIFKFFRIDMVWRFAPQLKTPSGATINNTTKQNFGVFGSLRFQF